MAAAGSVGIESEAAKAKAEATTKTTQIVKSSGAVARAQTTSTEDTIVDTTGATEATKESVVKEKAAATVSVEATGKISGEGKTCGMV